MSIWASEVAGNQLFSTMKVPNTKLCVNLVSKKVVTRQQKIS
jgi:hypothetical protein